MKIFSKIINDETKELECIVCGDTPLEGYIELERELAYNGKWYLKGYAPQESEEEKREKINLLSLTKREVFLALYKDKGITPEQIKAQITTPEALIEFEYANNYYRGNPLIEQIGETLGYSAEDLDYLFEKGAFTVKP